MSDVIPHMQPCILAGMVIAPVRPLTGGLAVAGGIAPGLRSLCPCGETGMTGSLERSLQSLRQDSHQIISHCTPASTVSYLIHPFCIPLCERGTQSGARLQF